MTKKIKLGLLPVATNSKNCCVGSSPIILYRAGFFALSFPPEDPVSDGTGVAHKSDVTTASCLLCAAATAPRGTLQTRSPLTTYKQHSKIGLPRINNKFQVLHKTMRT